MRRLWTISLAIFLALAGVAEAQEQDEGTRLERLIENSLSGIGREVTVRGFRGLLSGRAEMASLTVADEEGVWLTLSDAVLDWNRLALLRGRLQVSELTAARIEMPRLPEAEAEISPEATGTGLRLPDLPVAVIVAELSAEDLVLGAPVLGQRMTMTLDGSVRLDDGEGETRLELERTDGRRGSISLEGAFSNATRELDIDLLFDEAEGGAAANLLGIPGTPAVRFSVEGSDPIDDFTARITLATEGTERLGGEVRTVADAEGRRIEVALDGDLRPLFEPEYRDFFGSRAALEATAILQPDGETNIPNFAVQTRALELEGRAVIGSDGLPRLIDLEGALAAPGGGALVLPVAGPETLIERAIVDIGFDAAAGEAWDGIVSIEGLSREGFSTESLVLEGTGTITADPAAVTADLDFRAENLDFGRAEAQDAFGEAVTGRAEIDWTAGGPVNIETLRIEGETYSAEAEGLIANAASTLDIEGTLGARAEDLRAFSGLAGRPLSGDVRATVSGRAGVFSGLADIRATAIGRDLAVGEDRFDPYLSGETTLEFGLRRTTAGTFVDTLRLTSDEAEIAASGTLRSGEGGLSARARLGTLAPLAPGLSGAGEVELDATMSGGIWTFMLDGEALSTQLSAEGTLAGAPDAPVLTAAGEFAAADLDAWSALAGRDLGGSAELEFSARAEPLVMRYNLGVEGRLRDVRSGVDELDPLLAGEADVALDGELDDGTIRIERAALRTGAAQFEASGVVGPDLRGLAAEARLRLEDIGLLAEDVAGPASLVVTLEPQTPLGPWDVSLDAEAPGLRADADGTVRDLTGVPEASGSLNLTVEDLAPYGPILDRRLGGSVALSAAGSVRADLSTFDLSLEASAENAVTGVAPVDRVLAGTARLELDATRAGEEIQVRSAMLSTPLLEIDAQGALGADTAFGFDARLADLAPFVDGFSGPVTAEGRAESAGADRVALDVSLTGPAGARADVSGTVAASGATASLDIDGAAPLGLLNGVIAPRAAAGSAQFDLRLDGPLALESLSGRITTSDALVTAPVLNLALENIAGSVDLSGGRAVVDLDSRFRGGGSVRIDGPVGLSGGFSADLSIILDRVRLTDPALYQALLDARLSVIGPLTGGAEIAGRVAVREAEIRIPSSIGGAGAGIPDLTHVDEPPDVRTTRARAGLLGNGAAGDGVPVSYGLDILVDAPNRIFVRGRGLDAELGGQVRIAGTTSDVAPAGRFDLIRGRLDILGRRLGLTEGSIELTGALDPRLRLVAETRVEDVDVSIIVEGPASDPEIRFASRPELPEDEVLALLLFGRGIETLSPLQIARLAGAVATLGSSGGGLLGGLREGVGLADLDVTTGENGGTAVRAGAYIADNIYTDVTIDTEGETEINLNLDLSESITVRGSTSNTGESGLGVFFERDY